MNAKLALSILVIMASVSTAKADAASGAGAAPSVPLSQSLEVYSLKIDKVDVVLSNDGKKTLYGSKGKNAVAVVFPSKECDLNVSDSSYDEASTGETDNCGECAQVIDQAILKKASLELIGQFTWRKRKNSKVIDFVFKAEPYCTSEPKALMPSI